MGAVDLTITGSNYKKIVTDRTLDREGFFIPNPPHKLDMRRVKSAAISRSQEPNHGRKSILTNNSPMIRPKSAAVSLSRRPEIVEKENENQNEHPVRWTTQQINPNDMKTKHKLNVCEVMEKMRAKSDCAGATAPPCSPKGGSAIVGKRFVPEQPVEPPCNTAGAGGVIPNGYLNYRRRKQLSYLQKDMTVTGEPSDNRVIEIPCAGSDEPDEESVEVVGPGHHPLDQPPHRHLDNTSLNHRPSAPTPPHHKKSTGGSKSDIYRSVYLKDYRDYSAPKFNEYREAQCRIPCGVDRPKPDTSYVRYTPNTYRFKESRGAWGTNGWDRKQPRAPFNHTKTVTTRRPTQSIYVGSR